MAPPSSTEARTTRAAVKPRKAAALLVLSGTRVLMVKRPNHFSYPGAFVFPGGTVSSTDSSLMHTALRETFEETGLLLSTTPIPMERRRLLSSLQKEVHDGVLSFDKALEALDVTLIPSDDLIPFSVWTTPVGPAKRYETHFFVTRLPSHLSEEAVVGDGGIEVVGTHWLPTERIPAWIRQGKTPMHSAQIYLTCRLAWSLGAGEGWDGVLEVARQIGRVEVLMRRTEEDGKRVENMPNGDKVIYEAGAGSAGKAWVELSDRASL
ncbi:hypothetical protein CcaverHIS002_0207170 [Cutaneotrichosporon cavernicola]|uniref:Nudix hydrolase domain-containing protein n=1 Tax=Cutaneotrichosporon cavernicola TaxID=279322 RepID=A0AA48I492_9TREE|nr:uncharacterized protein CcaverHIS019_0207160 [Cutaneotrichosporon cavernicola]BEI81557.1 hypothetical protein CcaverHIS002_0207170 [Cutaneotrichosporon cavernicola]BEI89354.1 hypothetical protein CcaverHIS019_0207160 [Cutaneotrichosporon cavernicola]BEI97129.1 hypothetical protein CcaverHIS631_0207180 [Cutaneotrichosporon cavernicola]BEJ04902.1 hypothetical protein CcaverHIS641_0207190 [Cutaneotrichosporon cavernicola]